MKKNKMMRLASVLLVLCLLTTSVISGTFAKYVTSDSASDQARVAKWGIVLDINGTLFDDAYVDVDNGNTPAGEETTGITVQSANGTDLVVAPGTQNDDGMIFSIKGTAETSVRIDYVLQLAEDDDDDPKDIFLAAGDFRDWTVSSQNEKYPLAFNNAEDYYPVVFKLEQTKPTPQVIKEGTLADIKEALAAISGTVYAPNTELDAEFKLTWAWDFDDNGNGTYDKQDTLLGNLQAETVELMKLDNGAWVADEINVAENSKMTAAASGDDPATFGAMSDDEYCLQTQFYFEVSATQVD